MSTGLLSSLLGHFIIEFLQRFGFTSTLPSMDFILVGTGILFILYTLLSGLLGSSILGGIGLVITAIIFGSVNRAKIHYRAEPLFPNDFLIAKEVPFLIEMIGWLYTVLIVITIGVAIFFAWKIYRKKLRPKKANVSKKTEVTTRILKVLVSSVALFYMTQFHKSDNLLREFYFGNAYWTFDQQLEDYQNNGFIAGFLANLQGELMDEPSGYSRPRVADIVEKYQQLAEEMNADKEAAATDTNILFVMNESFSDPFNLKGLHSEQDPLEYYREITKENLNGKVLSPTFGGGTNANEFQALTSFSPEPFNPQITSPYMQIEERFEDYPTIVHKLSRLNYHATAIHPYDKSFFRRDEVYEQMGFDLFLHDENMKDKDTVSKDHLFISDASTYKEAFEVLHATKETDFIHMVTMQNHTPYAEKYEEVGYRVTGSGNDEEANGYFQDLENSDKALRKLIDQIDQYPEPIIMIFWGDHLPGLYRGDIREANNEFTLRQTPFLVYSNTLDLNGEVTTTSPIYFNQWIYEWLGIKLTAYDALLVALEKVLPLIDNGMYVEQEEIIHLREELSEDARTVLEEYSLMLYDITTGEQYAHDLDFFE